MKKRNFKRVLTIVLALSMMFTLSMVAFADGDPDGSVDVVVRFATYNLNTRQFSYSYENPYTVDFYSGDTAYDVVNRAFGNDATWYYNWYTHFLTGLTINNVSYPSIRVEAAASCYNYDGEYIGGNAIIDSLNQLDEFDDCGGIYLSLAMLMENEACEGYYVMGDMQHMCTITYDWVFEVDYACDNPDLGFVYPPNSTSLSSPNYMYTMDECALSDGDIVRLTYGLVWVIFE